MALFGIAAGILSQSTGVFAQSTDPSPYCYSAHQNMSNNGCTGNYGFNITKVELNGVTQTFTCNTGTVYRYYNTSNLTTLKRGVTYTLKVTTASTVYPTSSAGWIDFGSDQEFAQSGDYLGSQLGSNAPTLSYTFTVPGGATPGKTRLRVRCDYYSAMNSTMHCGNPTNYYGETLDFDVEIEQTNYPDLAIGSFVKPFNVCGDNADSIAVMLNNYGNASLSNFPITCIMTGTMNGSPVNQTFNSTVTATVGILGTYRFVFPSPINTNQSGSLTFKIYTGVATDGDRTNDTITVNKTFFGTPSNPSVSNVDRCGVGTVQLTCTPANAALDNIRWYSAASGGATLGAGSTITSPFYTSSTTVYAQASRNGATGSFAPSTTGNTVYWGGTSNEQGGMMNIIPTKTMIINNIFIRKYYGNTANYKVFIRVGGFQGYETNQSAWTLAGSRNSVGGGANTMVPINIGGFILEEGVTYGIYVQCLGDDFWIRYNGAPPFYESNADMLMVNGSYLYGNFSNVVPWYCIDIRWDYTTMCLGNRVPVNVSVKPVPNGTTLIKGSTFNGAFNSGTAQDPDITASGDIIEYNLVPPTGYSNSTYGTNWSVSALTIKSPGGADLPIANKTITDPSVSGNGKLRINPPAGFTDSLMAIAITVTAQGCDTVFYRSVFFAPRPVATFTASQACDGAPVQFDNNTVLTTGSVEYLWNFGDGKTSNLINPAHIYPTHGTYNVSLTATSNYGYVSVYNLSITVFENPQAEFGFTNVCKGSATPFADGSIIPAGNPTFEWNFGDGSFGTGSAPNHQYANTGVYLVTMKVTANGCSDQTQHYVTYAPRAVPNFSIQGGGCNSDEVILSNSSTLSSGQMGYTWDFGDNTTSTQLNPKHEYTAFGTISITLTVTTDMGCTNQIMKQINLIEAPHANFSTSLLCNQTNVDFTNSTLEPGSANTTYTWSFSDGSTFNTKDISKTFPGVGTYTATLTATADNGCSDVYTQNVVLEETPLVEFYASDVCEGTAVNFQNATVGNNNNLNYAWDFGTSGTSTVKNPSMILPVGQTSVTLTATTPSSGCEASVTKVVNVNQMPVLSNVSISSGQQGNGTMTISFNATPAGTAYSVFWGDGGRSFGNASGTTNNEIYTYPVDGKYNVEVKLDNKGCLTTGTAKSNVFRTSIVNFSEGNMKVYPNPTAGSVNLDLEGLNTSGMQIDVYASNGQKIDGQVQINGSQVQLDLSQAAPGVYLVKVTTVNGIHTARITVNN